MATQTSATLSTHEDGALRAKKVGRSVVAVLAAALAAATLAFFAAEARAGSFDSEPPKRS